MMNSARKASKERIYKKIQATNLYIYIYICTVLKEWIKEYICIAQTGD